MSEPVSGPVSESVPESVPEPVSEDASESVPEPVSRSVSPDSCAAPRGARATAAGAPALLGVVPVGGTSVDLLGALLGEHSLLGRAVDVLRRAGADRVVVVAPADRQAAVRELLGPAGVLVLAGGPGAAGAVLAALEATSPPAEARVVVHVPEHPLVSAGQVRAALAALDGRGVDGVLTTAPVTDTVKRLDARGRVVDTLDRERHRAVSSPQAYRAGRLREVLSIPPPHAPCGTGQGDLAVDVLPGLCLDAGVGVAMVEAPARDLRVLTSEQLEVARALWELGHTG